MLYGNLLLSLRLIKSCDIYFLILKYEKSPHLLFIFLSLTLVSLSSPWSDLAEFCIHPSFYEPRYEKTGFLHMRKQRRRSAAQ